MSNTKTPISAGPSDLAVNEREQGRSFQPKFDAAGLLTAVVIEESTGRILMVAFMDREALDRTIASGKAHFHSRSRGKLWMKGETSGNTLTVIDILVDCDQDALVLLVSAVGPACHTGAASCFYRRMDDGRLAPVT
ncbi:Phosphoribosyl-AMP cyclohydrolase [Alteripontixanthobacter maritimus]|uniref:Phosphoribosyl-AMP cyclohydrolase n=1 Tax=Alteripontixanthobacter maritimus TaxID=2161824 RepID=A0A369QAG2_9SPHN|nr:phosphoribosyl-AMP cyclohydrolase [Alteripontixanthobacter maritimus]RDC59909.1 Phosphoribosyl-AMP cyclohydrolase [Alteripontixanthobacter maritimus]